MGDTTALGYTPAFQFTNNGADVAGIFYDRLISLRVESVEGDGEADKLEVLVDNRGGAIGLPTVGDQSTKLSVAMGYQQTGLYDQGTYFIDGVGILWAPFSVRFTGTSVGLNNNLKAPIAIANAAKTVADVVNGIAQTAGVGAVIDPSIGSQTIPFLNQYCSSGQILQWLERQYSGLAKFADGTLSFTQRGTGMNASGETVPVIAFDASDFGTGSEIDISSRSMYSKVRASYWDKINNNTVYVENTNGSAGKSTVPYWLKMSYPSKDEAQAAANATMTRLQQGVATGILNISKGDASIRGGYLISISGIGEGADGQYTVSRATHLLTKAAGLLTTLEVYSTAPTNGSEEPEPITTPPGSGGIGSA